MTPEPASGPDATDTSQPYWAGDWPALPRDRALYRDLPAAVLDWSMLEIDLGGRAGWNGYVEVVAGNVTARVLYLDAREAATIGRDADGPGRPLDHEGLRTLVNRPEARLSVYTLEPSAARAAVTRQRGTAVGGESHADAFRVDRPRAEPLPEARPYRPDTPAPPDLRPVWSELLAFTEGRTDAARGPGTFDRAWRSACLGLAEVYPELDPFLEDVLYKGGQLSLRGSPRPEALTAAYLATLEHLGVKPDALAQLLTPMAARHKDAWLAAGLWAICPL